jgi:hypothetical protein
MSAETILLRCDGCGANLRVAAGRMRPGASAPCPRCGSSIRLPGPSAAPPAEVEEIQCQICGTLLRLRADRRPPGGGTAPCPRCKSTVTIPPVGPSVAAAPAASVPGRSVPAPSSRPIPLDAAPAAPTARPVSPRAAEAPPPRLAAGPAAPAAGADSEILPAGIGARPVALASPPRAEPRPEPSSEPPPEVGGEAGAAGREGDEPRIEIQDPEAPEEAEAGVAPPRPRPAAPDRSVFWTVEIGGETLHPGGVAELRLWARQGKLRAEDRVRRGTGDWTPAREVPELASLFARSRPAPEKTRIAVRGGLSRETRQAGAAGLAGGALAVPPVAALLIFSGEFERVAAALEADTLSGLGLLCAGVLLTGAAAGLAMAALQKQYDRRGEVVNLWSMSGASLTGLACGVALGLAALSFWPPSSPFALLCGFALFGAAVSLLTLMSHRWLFQERRS